MYITKNTDTLTVYESKISSLHRAYARLDLSVISHNLEFPFVLNPCYQLREDSSSTMVLVRSLSKTLLVFALLAVIASQDAAEAGMFDGMFANMQQKMNGMMNDMKAKLEATKKRLSVLSKYFGEGRTRGDLTLPEIFNNVFSRNNSIVVSNMTTLEFGGGDGPGTVIGVSNGGTLAVTNYNGKVTVYTDKAPPKTDGDKNDDDKKEEEHNAEGGEEEGEIEASPEGDMDSAYMDLLSDWDKFVTHEMWDVQESAAPSKEPSDEDEQLTTSSRVVNGVFFDSRIPSGAQFAVKFFYNNEENFYCSGSLIGYPYVLTAAHCGVVVGDQIRVGARFLRSGYNGTVAEVVMHPEFDASTLVNDLAIVRLDGLPSKKELNQNGVKAARVNRNSSFPEEKFVGVLSAHGSVETDGRGVSNELRTTRHTVYDMDKCREEITQGELGKEKTYLCGGDGARSTTCVGDSGAGLWHYRVKRRKDGRVKAFYEVFGVVSFGEVTDEALCPRGPPSVFQRTSANFRWMKEVVGKENMA